MGLREGGVSLGGVTWGRGYVGEGVMWCWINVGGGIMLGGELLVGGVIVEGFGMDYSMTESMYADRVMS